MLFHGTGVQLNEKVLEPSEKDELEKRERIRGEWRKKINGLKHWPKGTDMGKTMGEKPKFSTLCGILVSHNEIQ